MSERATWIPVSAVESDEKLDEKKTVSAPSTDSTIAGASGFKNFLYGARKTINVALAVLCFAGFGAICWNAALFFATPEFSEATAKFKASGHAADGERLAELGKVCRNGSGTPLACELVYFHHLSGLEMAAVKQERGVERE